MPAKKRKLQSAAERTNPNIPKDLVETINRVWPGGTVELFDKEESYFWELQTRLERKLRSIKGATVTYEHEARGTTEWSHDEFGDEDLPEFQEEDRSYHLYFLRPDGDPFRYKTEEEPLDPDMYTKEERESLEEQGEWMEGPIPGEGEFGLAVGVSLVAPIGIIAPMHRETFENGDSNNPSFEPGSPEEEDTGGESYLDLWRKHESADVIQGLERLDANIAKILEALGIRVLRKNEAEQPVPWLRGDDGALPGRSYSGPRRVLFQGSRIVASRKATTN